MSLDTILIADDEPMIRGFLSDTLRRLGKRILTASDGEEALTLLQNHSVDLLITDMKMPKKSGLELLKAAKKLDPQLIVILITAFGTIENAVEATKEGAFNYLIKPFSVEAIETLVNKAEEHERLVNHHRYLKDTLNTAPHSLIDQLLKSPSMKKILTDLNKISMSSAPVFITGESGTGKEVIAHAIHNRSDRSASPLIKVNCAAIPETLIESEFFGHEKGSFTGALSRRIGRFELAHKGTLLLDEVTEIPLHLQSKLLRAIQEMEFERLGSNQVIKVDTRLIATSNRNMEEAVDKKIFREDLYYRLNVIPIQIPPLRDRQEDILPLAHFFLERFCQENHQKCKHFSPLAKELLFNHSWPGNVRELSNMIERSVVMNSGEEITEENLYLPKQSKTNPSILNSKLEKSSPLKEDGNESLLPLTELEKKHILQALKNANNNRTQAAKILGISLKTLRNKLKTYTTLP